MLRALVPILLLAFGSSALACVNTSYSRKEEGQITSDITKIIAGQFPEHSEAFYDHQRVTLTAKLKKDPKDVEARNDLAAALLKLKRYGEAEKELLRIDSEHPNRYKTHANLGVLYKKTHKYAKAAAHTRKALEIKPEGHLGLGDYYLRMLDWRAREAANDPSVEKVNFLGVAYDRDPDANATNPLVNKEHLVTLIKADRHFPETYLILGDVLYEEGDLQNAARAYAQTLALLRDSSPDGILRRHASQRLEHVAERWRSEAEKRKGYVFDHRYYWQIQNEFDAATEWLINFQQVEAELIASEAEEIDFAMVQSEMTDRNLDYLTPIYHEVGSYRGSVEKNSSWWLSIIFNVVVGAIGLCIVAMLVIWVVRKTRAIPLSPAN